MGADNHNTSLRTDSILECSNYRGIKVMFYYNTKLFARIVDSWLQQESTDSKCHRGLHSQDRFCHTNSFPITFGPYRSVFSPFLYSVILDVLLASIILCMLMISRWLSDKEILRVNRWKELLDTGGVLKLNNTKTEYMACNRTDPVPIGKDGQVHKSG